MRSARLNQYITFTHSFYSTDVEMNLKNKIKKKNQQIPHSFSICVRDFSSLVSFIYKSNYVIVRCENGSAVPIVVK